MRSQRARSWRTFSRDDGWRIERALRVDPAVCCPRCEALLEAQPESRAARYLVLDASGYDLVCRGCRRFWCVVRHTPRSLRLLRMRRFVAAVRAVEPVERADRQIHPAPAITSTPV